MGQNGNWREEDYTFKILEQSGFFKVIAYTKDGSEAGNASFRPEYDLKGWSEMVPSLSDLTVIAVTVHPPHQRKGLATEMYRLIEEYTGKTILEGQNLQSEDAKALWRSRKK